MKNINMKKVVAGAAALGMTAMLAGAVVAANVNGSTFTSVSQLTKAQLFNNAGVPSVNIAVGSAGQPADVVWAGNIAAAIGQKAYTTSDASGSAAVFNGVTVKVGSTSTSTVTGDGYLQDDINITQSEAPFSFHITNSDYSKLYNDDITGNITGDSSYSIKETEKIDLNGNSLFSDNKDVEALMVLVNKGDFDYNLSFEGQGLPHSDALDNYFATGDDLDIKFMGKDYSLQSIASDGKQVKLVESGSKVTKNSGDEISLTGTNGEDYTLVIGHAYDDGDNLEIQLNLMENGTQVASDTFKTDDDVEFAGYEFGESISVVNILDDSSNSNNDLVTLSVGNGGLLELKDGDVLPGYEDGSDDLWKVSIDGDANYIRSISVYNQDARWNKQDSTDADAGLLIGDSIELPLGLGSFDFIGLTNETKYDFTVGDDQVEWADGDGTTHALDFYYDDVGDSSVAIDGEDYYFKLLDDGNVSVLNGDQSDDDPVTGYEDVNADDWTAVTLEGSNNVDVTYKMKLSGNDLHLALAPKAYTLGKSTGDSWTLVGTIDSGSFDSTELENVDETFFNAVDVDSDSDSTAVFKVTDSDGKVGYFLIDPNTGDLAVKDDYDLAADYYAQAMYGVDDNSSNKFWSLDQDDSDNDMAAGYTNYGSYMEVDGSLGKITVPQDQLYLQMFLGESSSSTSTTVTGSTFTLTADGQVDSNSDTGLSAQLISHNVTGGSTGTSMTPAAWNVGNNQLVWLDSQAPNTPLIVVGGYMVNSLAKNVGMEDLVTKAGDWVAGSASNGNIYVAGFTKDDTASAAKELIAAIENMN